MLTGCHITKTEQDHLIRPLHCDLTGDTYVAFFSSRSSRRPWAAFWFHTSFVQDNVLHLSKHELDGTYKDIKHGHKKFDKDFAIELQFEGLGTTEASRMVTITPANNPSAVVLLDMVHPTIDISNT